MIRNSCRLTRKAFADLLGVSFKTVESWELGINTPGSAAARLLDILGYDCEYAMSIGAYPLQRYDGSKVKKLRVKLGLSRELFALAIGVSENAAASWEQNRTVPNGPASRIMDLLDKDGDILGLLMGCNDGEEWKKPMDERLKVSVIIATHNNADTIGNSIDSIWSRSFRDMEVIVVDVNSTDGTKDLLLEMAAEDPQVTFLADGMGSLGHARNMGLDHARAPYIVFADPDGYFRSNALEYMSLMLDESPDADMFTCETDCFGNDAYGRTGEELRNAMADANDRDGRKQEMDSRLIRHWAFDCMTMYRASFLRDNAIRFYDMPGRGRQDDAFRLLASAKGIASATADAKYDRMMDIPRQRITDAKDAADVCREFRFLKAKLQEDEALWQKMRLVFWQAYYDRNMLWYERLPDESRAVLSKQMQADMKEAIRRKEYSREHFDIRVREEMELLMRSADAFDRHQKKRIAKRETERDAGNEKDARLTEIRTFDEKDGLERMARESARHAREMRREEHLDRKWLLEEMTHDLAPLRMLLGLSVEEMGNLIGVSGSTYRNIETGKKEVSWDQYMALLFVFRYNGRTAAVTDTLGLYPRPLQLRVRNGVT